LANGSYPREPDVADLTDGPPAATVGDDDFLAATSSQHRSKVVFVVDG
jgi:hypothetical protein